MDGDSALTPKNRIRVDENAVPVVQKFMTQQAAVPPTHLSPHGVAEGPAAQYVKTMRDVGDLARTHYAQQRNLLRRDVQEILASLKDLMETESQAADLLKRFLKDVAVLPEGRGLSGGAAAAAGGAGAATGPKPASQQWG